MEEEKKTQHKTSQQLYWRGNVQIIKHKELKMASSLEDLNSSVFPIDFSSKKSRRSFVMEDLGEVKRNLNLEKWLLDQVEMKLCQNKQEMLQNLQEKDFAIQKLQGELENLRIGKDKDLTHAKSTNFVTKTTKSVKSETDKVSSSSSTSSGTLKRLATVKVDDKSAARTRNLPQTAAKASTNIKALHNTNGNTKQNGSRAGLFRSKTFRGETTATTATKESSQIPSYKSTANRAVKQRPVVAQESRSNQLNGCNSEDFNAEMAANLKRLTEEHSKLQAEYARVRTLLIEANIKCASGMTSPIPPSESSSLTNTTDGLTKSIDDVTVDASAGDKLGANCDPGDREGFRKEVIRLKEELLAAQDQCRILSYNKNQLEQDLTERENLLLQLSKQIEQMIAHHEEVVKEKELAISKLSQEISSLNDRLKESETEYYETKEFLQEENNSLTEMLRDYEEKTWQYHSDMEKLNYQLETKNKSCEVLSKMVDQAQLELRQLKSELDETQDNAHKLLITQGAELSDVSYAVKELHELVLTVKNDLLEDASQFGVDINASPDNKARSRRSIEGRRFVQAILEAAKAAEEASESTLEGDYNDSGVKENIESQTDSSKHSSHVKEVHDNVVTLGKMVKKFVKFAIMLLDEAEEEKAKLEFEFRTARNRSEEFQKELDDNVRKRWSIEEKNKDLSKELIETRVSLKDARESVKSMWNAVDEKASWMIENKRLRGELSRLETEKNLLSEELTELKRQREELTSSETRCNGHNEISESKQDPYFLQEQIGNLQRIIFDKEESVQETKKQLQTTNKNLQVAEIEVRKLDKIIDHVLQVLLNAHDLDLHPVLQQLWKDLDGPGYVATKFDESATIV
ncbi:hypothetical protein CHUAL_005876 [Chamberlinius hualienensis]